MCLWLHPLEINATPSRPDHLACTHWGRYTEEVGTRLERPVLLSQALLDRVVEMTAENFERVLTGLTQNTPFRLFMV